MKYAKAYGISFGVVAEEKLPISLAWLSGVFEKLEIEYEVTDFTYELSTSLSKEEYKKIRHNTLKTPSKEILEVVERCVDGVLKYNPEILCVSAFSYRQYHIAKIFLQRLRARNETIEVSGGGPGLWYIPASSNYTYGWELCQEGLVDTYTLGNGEETIVRQLQGESPNNIVGVNSKSKFEKQGDEEWTELIRKIQEKYIRPSYNKVPIVDSSKNNKEIFITGANGCPGKCAFCSIREYIPFPSYRDGKEIADECYELFKQTGVTRFKRTDALANGHTKHFRAFNERIIELKKEDSNFKFEYNCMFVPKDERIHNEEYYSLMSQAGCTSLDLGIESGSERLRKDMKKPYTNAQLDWHFEMCHKYNIKNNISIFVGFPTETEEDFNENLKMLDRYQKYIDSRAFDEIQHCGKFVMYTKTYIYNNLEEYDVVITDHSVEPMEWTCLTNPTNTLEERIRRESKFLEHAKKLGYRVDVYDSTDK